MTSGQESKIFYFDNKGPINTEKTLDIALECCRERKIQNIVVASSTGETALKLHEKVTAEIDITMVTYSAGSRFPEEVNLFLENRDEIMTKGITIVRGMHALSATEKGFQNKYKNNMLPLNIVADSLRMFCHGVKVCVEIAIMAAEAGYILPDQDVVGIAGSHRGADTAVVLKPAYAANMFETKIRALLCMPS
jgi:hypothetical protein